MSRVACRPATRVRWPHRAWVPACRLPRAQPCYRLNIRFRSLRHATRPRRFDIPGTDACALWAQELCVHSCAPTGFRRRPGLPAPRRCLRWPARRAAGRVLRSERQNRPRSCGPRSGCSRCRCARVLRATPSGAAPRDGSPAAEMRRLLDSNDVSDMAACKRMLHRLDLPPAAASRIHDSRLVTRAAAAASAASARPGPRTRSSARDRRP